MYLLREWLFVYEGNENYLNAGDSIPNITLISTFKNYFIYSYYTEHYKQEQSFAGCVCVWGGGEREGSGMMFSLKPFIERTSLPWRHRIGMKPKSRCRMQVHSMIMGSMIILHAGWPVIAVARWLVLEEVKSRTSLSLHKKTTCDLNAYPCDITTSVGSEECYHISYIWWLAKSPKRNLLL